MKVWLIVNKLIFFFEILNGSLFSLATSVIYDTFKKKEEERKKGKKN